MKKDQNLNCREKLWESFNHFAMSDAESSKEGKDRKPLSGKKNKWFNGCDDRWSVGKKKDI